jgi:hypothetical protein
MPDRSDRVTHRRRVLKPRRSLFALAARCVVVLVLVLFAAHWGFGRYADAKLRQDLARLRATGVPIYPADFSGPPVPDADNAALDLIAAGEFLGRPSEVMDRFNRTLDESALPLDGDEAEGIAAAVQYGYEALERVDRAMQKPAVRWPQIGGDLLALRKLAWNDVSRVTWLSGAAALAAHQRGNDAEALRHVGRMLFVADAVGQDPDIIAQTAAGAMRARAAGAVFQIAPDLRVAGAGRTSPEAVRALMTGFDYPRSDAAYFRGLEGRRAQTWELVKAYADGRADLGAWPKPKAEWSDRVGCAILRPFALNDARLLLAHDSRMIEAARGARTWPAMKRAMPDSDYPEELPRQPLLHLSAIMFAPRYDHLLKGHYWSIAAQRAATAALAVRLYAVDHGRQLPVRLEDLVPTYLPAVPMDPLADDNRPLGYDPDPANPRLYSVGDDGIDQGGSARPSNEKYADLIDGDFDRHTEDAVVHLILPPRIRHH